MLSWTFHFLFLEDFIYLFLEREEGKKKERERNINVWLPLLRPPLETWPATQACALTGNQTGDPLVHRPALSPLSYTSQAILDILNIKLWNSGSYLIPLDILIRFFCLYWSHQFHLDWGGAFLILAQFLKVLQFVLDFPGYVLHSARFGTWMSVFPLI